MMLAPVTIAWLYGGLLRIMPGMAPATYAAVVCAVLLPAAALEIRYWLMAPTLERAWTLARSVNPGTVFIAGLMLLLLVYLCVIGRAVLDLPLSANDPLEYFFVARAVYERQQLWGVYPMIDPDIARGFYGPWTHPPGFVLMIAWAFLIQGTASVAGIAKLINVFHMLPMALIAFAFAGGTNRYRGIVAALLVVTVPSFFQQMLIAHVDLSRIGLWTATFCLLPSWFRECRWRNSVALGVVVGLAMFVHSIGVLFWPIFAGLLILVRGPSYLTRSARVGVMAFACMAVVATDYWNNFQHFGRVIGDSAPLWEIKELKLDTFLADSRGIKTFSDKLNKGVWGQFDDLKLYGPTGAIFLFAAVAYIATLLAAARLNLLRLLRHVSAPAERSVFLLSALGFLAIVTLSAFLDMNLIVKNYRYTMTMLPLYAILAPILIDTSMRYLRLTRAGQAWLAQNALRRNVKGLVDRMPANWFQGKFLTLATALIVLFALVYVGWDAGRSLRSARTAFPITQPDPETLPGQLVLECAQGGNLQAIGAINQRVAASKSGSNAKILALRPSDMTYYAHFPFVSYLNPVLLPSFVAQNGEDALQHLTQLGITHILLPSYRMGEVENSAIGKIVGDPNLSTPEYNFGGFVLMRLAGQQPLFERDLDVLNITGKGSHIIDLTRYGTFETPVLRSRPAECTGAVEHGGDEGQPILRIKKQSMLRLGSILPLDPSRRYRISMEARGTSDTSTLQLGIATTDKVANPQTDRKNARRPNVLWGSKSELGRDWRPISAEFSGAELLRSEIALSDTAFITLVLDALPGLSRDEIDIRDLRVEEREEPGASSVN